MTRKNALPPRQQDGFARWRNSTWCRSLLSQNGSDFRHRSVRAFWVGAAGAVLAACGTALPLVPSPACPAPQVDTTGWQKFETEQFSFLLPPGLQEKKVQGIDALVWVFESDRNEIVASWGLTVGPLSSYRDMEGYTECEQVIGGKRANVVTFRTSANLTPRGKLFAGAYWADVGGDHPERVFVAFKLRGISSDREAHDQVLAMLRTVRFKR